MKKSSLKRKTKLRKRSKSKALLDKADQTLQNYFRREFPDDKCEACGARAEVRHHHIEKSKSNAGRFNESNLISLCYKCHSKISFGHYDIISTYSIKRGKKWAKQMEALKREPKQSFSVRELEEVIEKYGS